MSNLRRVFLEPLGSISHLWSIRENFYIKLSNCAIRAIRVLYKAIFSVYVVASQKLGEEKWIGEFIVSKNMH